MKSIFKRIAIATLVLGSALLPSADAVEAEQAQASEVTHHFYIHLPAGDYSKVVDVSVTVTNAETAAEPVITTTPPIGYAAPQEKDIEVGKFDPTTPAQAPQLNLKDPFVQDEDSASILQTPTLLSSITSGQGSFDETAETTEEGEAEEADDWQVLREESSAEGDTETSDVIGVIDLATGVVATGGKDDSAQGSLIGLLLFTFVLAIFLGFELISKVPSQLHTPLMSGSNAISGITIVGALMAAGSGGGFLLTLLGTLAVIFATINVVGGYMVTDRMLGMFQHKDKK